MEHQGDAVPVKQRLAALAEAVDLLVTAVETGGLDHLDASGLVDFLQDLEAVRNRLPLVDHRALRDAAERDVAGALGQGRLTRLLTSALRISAGEAHRRVRASEQVGDRVTVLGEHQPPIRAELAAAQRSGRITPEQVDIVCRGLLRVDQVGYDPAAVGRGELELTELAAVLGPRDLQVCTDRFVEHLDPDGSRPQDQLHQDRRYFELRRRRDGSWRGELWLTGPVGGQAPGRAAATGAAAE